jgi:putative transposase
MVIRKRLNLKIEGFVFITTTVRNWLPVFADDNLACLLITQFAESTVLFHSDIIAYCLMPSHLHAVVYLEKISNLSNLMGAFKSLSSRLIKSNCPDYLKTKLYYGDSFHLWKPRFDDYVFRNFDQLRIKITYIHDNPVRANLVENPIDWKYSSARDWMMDEKGIIDIRKIWFD